MTLLNKSKLIINKSIFYGHLYEIESLNKIPNLISIHKKKYKKANHHCCAATYDGEFIIKNDGEIGYPAKSILQVLQNANLTSHCIIISRIFGGEKLGPGNVSKAFRECARLLNK